VSELDPRLTPANRHAAAHELRGVIEANLSMTDDALRHRCEQTIRNYDPCISCAAHFLRLDMDRG